MNEMVERVARALAFVEGGKITGPSRHKASYEFGWRPDNPQMEEYAEKHWREHLTAAQFAIDAMKPMNPLSLSDVIAMTTDGVLVGLVMKLTGGSANPVVVQQILDRIRSGAGDE